MTTETEQVRRRTNGTVDIDYYRNRSLMLRREAMTNVARGVNFSVVQLVAAALLVALIAMISRGSASNGTAANAAPAAIMFALETR